MALAVGLIAFALWWFVWRQPPFPEGLVQANGRFEGDHYTVSGKWPGRVLELRVHEGDSVKLGQVMVTLDDVQIRTKVQQAQAAVAVADAQLRAAQTSLGVFTKNVPLKIATAKAGVSHRRAEQAASLANQQQHYKDAQRFSELLRRGTVEQHRSELAELSWQVAKAQYRTAQAATVQAEKQWAESELGWQQSLAQADQVAAVAAQSRQAQAQLAEALSVLADMVIYAPASGMVTTRIADAGEMVAAGSPLFDIVDLDQLYLKVYIPEQDLGKVRLGLPAQLYTDAFPGQPFPAVLRYIAATAEFTPKEVQTPDERVKLVYAVKLYLTSNPQHQITPGMPADAVIRWQEASAWAKPRW
ncbi:MAG: HlyD family efflux transporter periplasmic adaptor subunit [Methylococcaceae bacterium]|nr:HlyD family efflux transporter periplasmic adaptor subunit [Methylococcaceae bacterium]